jgi:hypothetical protein
MGLSAAGGSVLSAWIALHWGSSWEQTVRDWLPSWLNSVTFGSAVLNPAVLSPAWLAAILFGIPAVALLALAAFPAIEVHEKHLKVGRREIGWNQVRRLDQTGWNVPLAVHLTLRADEKADTRFLLIHAGDSGSCATLLRYLRRYAREALLDGIPYRDFWGEPAPQKRKQLPPPRYQLLLPEEEEEVERMFQRLKTVGHLDQRGSDDK